MLLRDRLADRLAKAGRRPDYGRLAADVLGIRNAPPALAERLVAQALVLEDRQEQWKRVGERICESAPATPGIYILRDAEGRALYVGKAVNLRRRLRTHFAERRWRRLKPEFARACRADWEEVGSELEALLREAVLIDELEPVVNVQVAPPSSRTRAVPAQLARDVIVLVPSVEDGSVELVAARADGGWMIQRTLRSGADLAVHSARLLRFFKSPLRRGSAGRGFAPLVFSWLSGRGRAATRLDPHDYSSGRELRATLRTLFADERLFTERIVLVNLSGARTLHRRSTLPDGS